jgi:hypothetical protein
MNNKDVQLLRAMAQVWDAHDPNALSLGSQETELEKALTTSSGFVGINLLPAAKIFLPLFAGLRHRIPAGPAEKGATQAIWRMLLGYTGVNFGAADTFGVAEKGVGPDATFSATTIQADYKGQSVKGNVSLDAIDAALDWDNAMTIETMAKLTVLLKLEELHTLFDNAAAIAAPVITGTASTATAVNTFTVGTYAVKVTAITGQGTLTGGAGMAGTVLNNVGESVVSNDGAVVVGAGASDFLDISWPAVPGALGYKVYCNAVAADGNFYLVNPNLGLAYANKVAGSFLSTLGDPIVVPSGQTYVGVNHVQITALPLNTQPIGPAAVDHSVNANVGEGLWSWMTKSTIYGQALPNARIGVDCAGLPLTVVATGIDEFDSYLLQQWQINHTAPSLIVCSSKSVRSISNKIAAAGGSTQIRLDVYKERNSIAGGLYVGYYINKFAASMAGMNAEIPIWAHPYMPDGSFQFLSEDVPPETLPYAREAKNFRLNVRRPYTYFELGRTDISFPFSVYYNQVLTCLWPDSQGGISGARVDQ